jgi:hypothetical protein
VYVPHNAHIQDVTESFFLQNCGGFRGSRGGSLRQRTCCRERLLNVEIGISSEAGGGWQPGSAEF